MPVDSTPGAETAPPTSVLLIRLGSELFGVPGSAVREVTRYREPLPVPGAPQSMPGLISQRGAVLTAVDLRPLLGLPPVEPSRATRYVVAQHEEIGIALVADTVLDLVDLSAGSMEPLPAALDPVRARLLQAVARHENQLLALLDLDALIAVLREEP